MKRVSIYLLVPVVCVMLVFPIAVAAKRPVQVSSNKAKIPIPSYMKPDSIIVYDDNLNMQIIQGGFSEKPMPPVTPMYIPPLPPNLFKDEEQGFRKLQEDIAEAINNGETNSYPVAYPVAGEKVVYGDDGYVQQSYFRDPSELSGYSIHLPQVHDIGPFTIRTTKPWGKYNNYISYNNADGPTGSTTGYGRFTQYYDQHGDHENILVDGDVATDMSLDTIADGTKIRARNDDSSTPGYNTVYDYYYKNDVGPLCGTLHQTNDDAVLDVWGKDGAGLTHLGIARGKNVSLNMAHYYHSGISYTQTF